MHALRDVSDPKVKIIVSLRDNPQTAKRVVVRISDNGAGVPANIKSNIFDPFFTSKDTGPRLGSEGMGLGLAITKQIVESHSGVIAVNDNPGGGAVFVVSFPFSD